MFKTVELNKTLVCVVILMFLHGCATGGETKAGNAEGGSVTVHFGSTQIIKPNSSSYIDEHWHIYEKLSEQHESMSLFFRRMADVSETVEGNYESNRDFYRKHDASLNTLIVRSRARMSPDKKECILSYSDLESIPKQYLQQDSGEDFYNKMFYGGKLYECTEFLLLSVKYNLDLTEKIHKRENKLSPAVVNLLQGITDTLTENALRLLTLKKNVAISK